MKKGLFLILIFLLGCSNGNNNAKDVTEIIDVIDVKETVSDVTEEKVDPCANVNFQVQLLNPKENEIINGKFTAKVRVVYNGMDNGGEFIQFVGLSVLDGNNTVQLGAAKQSDSPNIYEIPFDTTKFKDNKYSLLIFVKDINNCQKNPEKPYPFVIDNSAPDVTFHAPDDGKAYRTFIEAVFTVKDTTGIDSVDLIFGNKKILSKKLNGKKEKTYYVDYSLKYIPEGDLKIKVITTDTLGNKGEKSITIQVLSKAIFDFLNIVNLPYLSINGINWFDYYYNKTEDFTLDVMAIATDSGVFVSEVTNEGNPVHFYRLSAASSKLVHLEDVDKDGKLDLVALELNKDKLWEFGFYFNIEKNLDVDSKLTPDYVKVIKVKALDVSSAWFGDLNDDGYTDYIVGTRNEILGLFLLFGTNGTDSSQPNITFTPSDRTDTDVIDADVKNSDISETDVADQDVAGEDTTATDVTAGDIGDINDMIDADVSDSETIGPEEQKQWLTDFKQLKGATSVTDIDVGDVDMDGIKDVVVGRDDFDIVSIFYGDKASEDDVYPDFGLPVNIYTCSGDDLCKNAAPRTVKIVDIWKESTNNTPEIVVGSNASLVIKAKDLDPNADDPETIVKECTDTSIIEVLHRDDHYSYSRINVMINEAGISSPYQRVPLAPYDIYVDDINGDEVPDFITTNNQSGLVTVGQGLGQGEGKVTFYYSNMKMYPVGAKPTHIFTFDLNKDGIKDIVLLHDSKQFYNMIPSHYQTIFGQKLDYPSSQAILAPECYNLEGVDAAQIDLKNGADVVMIVGPETITKTVTDPTTNATTTTKQPETRILFYSSSEIQGTEKNYFDVTNSYVTTKFPEWMAQNFLTFKLGNFDGITGHLDIAAFFDGDAFAIKDDNDNPNEQGNVFALMKYQNTVDNGTFEPVTVSAELHKAIGLKPLQVLSAKLTNDPDNYKFNDLVLFHDLYDEPTEKTTDTGGNQGNTREDAKTIPAEIVAFQGTQSGQFGNPKLITEPEMYREPQKLTLYDVDGDGLLDLLMPQSGTEDVTIFKGKGPAMFYTGNPPHFAIGADPIKAVTLDWDQDGIKDLVVLLKTNIVISFGYKGDAKFNFEEPIYFYEELSQSNENQNSTNDKNVYQGKDPVDIAVMDANDDGFDDIVVLNKTSNDLYIYYSPGKRTDPVHGKPDVFPVLESPDKIIVTDIDADGCKDFVIPSISKHVFTTIINLKCYLKSQNSVEPNPDNVENAEIQNSSEDSDIFE